MCSSICLVKRFLFSSNKLQEKCSERDWATENIKSKDSTTFGDLPGSNTKAISDEVISSRKLPGFLAFIRLNNIFSVLSLKVKKPLSSNKKL